MAEPGVAQAKLADELKRMEGEYEPLMPVEKKLISYTLITGLALLVVLILVSRVFLVVKG